MSGKGRDIIKRKAEEAEMAWIVHHTEASGLLARGGKGAAIAGRAPARRGLRRHGAETIDKGLDGGMQG